MQINQKNIANYYKQMQINTASNQKHIVMLHDKLFAYVRDSITEGQDKRRERLDKAQNIIVQLQIALKLDREDELTHSLFLLYDYAYVLLDKNDIVGHRESLKVIEVLRDTFVELFKRK